MFKNRDNRFISKGIDKTVPKKIQLLCWKLMDQLVKENNIVIDYIQIFEFEWNDAKDKLILTHRQEELYCSKQYELDLLDKFNGVVGYKIWLIDDSENLTMLLQY